MGLLASFDWVVIAVYFVLVFWVAIWATMRRLDLAWSLIVVADVAAVWIYFS